MKRAQSKRNRAEAVMCGWRIKSRALGSRAIRPLVSFVFAFALEFLAIVASLGAGWRDRSRSGGAAWLIPTQRGHIFSRRVEQSKTPLPIFASVQDMRAFA